MAPEMDRVRFKEYEEPVVMKDNRKIKPHFPVAVREMDSVDTVDNRQGVLKNKKKQPNQQSLKANAPAIMMPQQPSDV
jgi:hypothetical protein